MPSITSGSVATKRARPDGGGTTTLLLFRHTDLRLHDNPAVAAAAEAGGPVVPAFVWSRQEDGHRWGVRGASEVYLKEAIRALEASLCALGSRLTLRRCQDKAVAGCSSPFAREVVRLVEDTGATSVQFNREHTPEGAARDAAMEDALRVAFPSIQITGHGSASQLLYSPEEVSLSQGFNGGHWGTLMPFLKACEKQCGAPPRCKPSPKRGDLPELPPSMLPPSCGVEGLGLAVMPHKKKKNNNNNGRGEHAEVVDWGAPIRAAWPAGEAGAMESCDRFVSTGMTRYERDRSRADLFHDTPPSPTPSAPPTDASLSRGPCSYRASSATSRLSVALRFGELSPRYLYWAIRDAGLPKEVTKTFSRRLHWRDLAYYHLASFPGMRTRGIRSHYDTTQWVEPPDEHARRLRCWQRGRTGYPIVDAGMRELYETGWMSQSVRMVCASFLVEHLRVRWQDGAEWFADTLCDSDSAINAMMWQNAGRSGIDQWNFVMSPENASQDPSGRYTRRYVPELAALPTKFLHKPWLATPDALRKAGVVLGETYPHRIVEDLSLERRRSVQAVLEMRRAHQKHNDGRGYDTITLPCGSQHRVFTKEEYRIGRDGAVLPPPPRRGRQGQRRSRVNPKGKPQSNDQGKKKNGKKKTGGNGNGNGTRQTTLTFAFTPTTNKNK